ncbi:MAG: phosphoenolpyruvate carboxykinase (ATP) [bacterium]|jgi:phosphoenolpyruvate carboxykinase (ATP)|nr:phosphoenolpyruvate carboxykinase (ATP) [bacterium]MDD3805692.1 phosphoenolpyruvate carboxykinase (ATP) [bacterium]
MSNESSDLSYLGLVNPGSIYRNLSVSALIEQALAREEGELTSTGALSVRTGKYTGRSPNDKFTVDEPTVHDEIAWGKVNVPIEEEKFDRIYNRMMTYLQGKDLFVFDGFVGADPQYRLPLRAVTELAWHNLFAHQLFLRPTADELSAHVPEFTVIYVPGFKADPQHDGTNSEAFIIPNFKRRIVIIGGTQYAGEMKKSIFTVMNYLLPKQDVCPMHCSANIGEKGDVALFFGLSGTGKTTLSADPERKLIGDDEHGWSDNGIFNFEGGCYAKCINLSRENEPQIWDAIRYGSVLENVVVEPKSRVPDYDCAILTENTRAGYPVDFIPNAVIPGVGGQPSVVVFLTADAFGILPPVSELTREQAMYHFLSGYTSKLAGTERGITEPEATFSTCFGSPFLPLSPMIYARLLGEKIEKYNTRVYLINTGWSGGPYGVGRRISIKHTRAIVTAALNGSLAGVSYRQDPVFNLRVPETCPGVPAEVLNPRNTWEDKDAYDKQAIKLARLFIENFKKFSDVTSEVVNAGPRAGDMANAC